MRTATLQLRGLATGLAAVLALGLPVVVMSAPQAQAAASAKRTAVSGSLTWGYKDSFRSYIAEETGRVGAPGFPQARASITAAGGASFAGSEPSIRKPAVNKASYRWVSTGGTINAKTGKGTFRFGGKVTLSYPNHYIHAFTFANPIIELDGKGGGRVLLDVAYNTGGGGGQPAKKANTADVAVATLSGAKATISGSQVTLSNAGATLTKAGSAAVNGFHTTGESLDPVSFVVTIKTPAASAPQTTKTAKPAKSAKPAKANAEAKASTSASASAAASASASTKAKKKAKTSTSASARPSSSATESVAAAPSESTVAADTTQVSSGGSNSSAWLLVLAASLVAAGVGGFLTMRRRRAAPLG